MIDERLPQAQELADLGLDLFRLGALGSETANLTYAALPQSGGLSLQLAWKDEPAKDFNLPYSARFTGREHRRGDGAGARWRRRCRPRSTRRAAGGTGFGQDGLGVPGRMMPVSHHPEAPHGRVLVDYAHTPDALATALQAARPHCEGRLMVVFGAGGDRDPGKRVLMGEAAAQFADWSLITDDNPRSEDPAAIRAAVRGGAPDALEVGDRADAIAAALAAMAPEDLLLIAGARATKPGRLSAKEPCPSMTRTKRGEPPPSSGATVKMEAQIMSLWTVADIAGATQGALHGDAASNPATSVTGVSIDTRSLVPGDLFIALRGPNNDAHDFAAQPWTCSASALLVERPLNLSTPRSS